MSLRPARPAICARADALRAKLRVEAKRLGLAAGATAEGLREADLMLAFARELPHPAIAHALERQPDMPRALDWYDYCLKRNPTDGTAAGATMTIRERYLPAWRLMEEGKYDAAVAHIDKWLLVEPNNTLGLHMKAHILEQAKRDDDALEVWKLAAASSALNAHAQTKVVELSQKLGKPVPPVAQALFMQQARRQMKFEIPRDQQ